jgi:hypothetical protein
MDARAAAAAAAREAAPAIAAARRALAEAEPAIAAAQREAERSVRRAMRDSRRAKAWAAACRNAIAEWPDPDLSDEAKLRALKKLVCVPGHRRR